MPDIESGLRALVRSRARGYCEYCRIAEQSAFADHEIDHVVALKHGGRTVAENLALCCTICNRYKGSDIASIDPETEKLTRIFHPRLDRWADHFELRDREIFGLTDIGRSTVKLLQMNRPARIRERKLPG